MYELQKEQCPTYWLAAEGTSLLNLSEMADNN